MISELGKDYEELRSFWDRAFSMTDDERQKEREETDPETGWKEMAPSAKLLRAACELGGRKKVLDYGCGGGWAGIAAAKSGCGDVTCADTANSCAELARFHAELYRVDDRIRTLHITPLWLSEQPDAVYDGFICSNVLDVIPSEAAEDILRQAARVTKEGASVVIGLNYCKEPVEDPEKHITVKYGNHIYINGILRLVSLTDEEWTKLLGKYFTVESLEHFAWPNETDERRRLFRLTKKA